MSHFSKGAMLCGQNLPSLTCALALKSPCTSLIAKYLLKLHASACRGSSFSDNISEIAAVIQGLKKKPKPVLKVCQKPRDAIDGSHQVFRQPGRPTDDHECSYRRQVRVDPTEQDVSHSPALRAKLSRSSVALPENQSSGVAVSGMRS